MKAKHFVTAGITLLFVPFFLGASGCDNRTAHEAIRGTFYALKNTDELKTNKVLAQSASPSDFDSDGVIRKKGIQNLLKTLQEHTLTESKLIEMGPARVLHVTRNENTETGEKTDVYTYSCEVFSKRENSEDKALQLTATVDCVSSLDPEKIVKRATGEHDFCKVVGLSWN